MKFILNVIWNWLGVMMSIVIGMALTPYILAKLGANGYGVWTLSFSLIESLTLFDFGLRSAGVKYVSHYYTIGDRDKLAEVLHTSFVWAVCMGGTLFAGVLLFAPFAASHYHISEQYKSQFPVLLMLIGGSFAVGLTFNQIRNAIDAVQRFDLTNRAAILGTFIRGLGTFLLLRAGYGLVEICILTIASQIFTYVLNYVDFRRVFPGQTISFARSNWAMFKQLASYGIHTFFTTLAYLGLMQGPPIVLAQLRSDTEVGYFSLPARLVNYLSEAVGRIAVVTATSVTALVAKGQMDEVRKMASYPNRYTLALFFPVAIWLFSHGERFLLVLAKPAVVEQSMRVLPWVVAGTLIGFIGQINSFNLLVAMGRHSGAARMMALEAAALVAGMYWLVPSYGISAAAWLSGGLMALNRGFLIPIIVVRVLNLRYVSYMTSIYVRPALVAIPVCALSYFLASAIPDPASTSKLVRVAGLLGQAGFIAAVYCAIAYFAVLLPEHRQMVKGGIERRWTALRAA